MQFCGRRDIDPLSPPIVQVADFLTDMFENGKEYSTINVARPALSAIGIKHEGTLIGSHPIICRLLKGIFNKKPPRVKYKSVWDKDIVLKYMQAMPRTQELSLKELSIKLTMLIALTKAVRPQTIHLLSVKNIIKNKTEFIVELSGLQKHDRPGLHTNLVKIKAFPHDKALCPYLILEEYLARTKSIRGYQEQLLISYIKPHKQVSRDTIKRWLHTMMKCAGIDIEMYGPYSTRSASVSKAARINMPINQIMLTAGWTIESTFQKFYHKEIAMEQQYEDMILNVVR